MFVHASSAVCACRLIKSVYLKSPFRYSPGENDDQRRLQMEGERHVSAHATTECPESGTGSSDIATMATDKGETSVDGKAEKRVTIEHPLDALPKDKGWAWMCLVGK